jgi:hypothetical protein
MSIADKQTMLSPNGSGDSLIVSIRRQRRLSEQLLGVRCSAFVGVFTSLVLAVSVVRAATVGATGSSPFVVCDARPHPDSNRSVPVPGHSNAQQAEALEEFIVVPRSDIAVPKTGALRFTDSKRIVKNPSPLRTEAEHELEKVLARTGCGVPVASASKSGGATDLIPTNQSALKRVEARAPIAAEASEIDLALASWLVAADMPEFKNLTRAAYFKQLDALTEQARQDMAKMQKVAVARGENPQVAKTRCAIFCNAVINLQFAYAEEFRQEKITPALLKSLYANPNNICLAGLLRTKRGSCVSMPLIYLVLGQRLGMPVHLVTIGKHYFIRWEEPGYRMNIEPTIVSRVAATPDDAVYLETEGVSREQLRGSDLRNLTHCEVVGNLLFARSAYWATKEPEYADRQRRDLSRARELAPDDFGIKETYESVFNRAGSKPAPVSINPKLSARKGNPI